MDKVVFVAGHKGMVGSAIVRKLISQGYTRVLTADRAELDLLNQTAVFNFFKKNKIDQVYLAAAKVGGIHANNTYPAQFIYENLMIQANIIHAAHLADVNKILFLGSSCIYPRLAQQPMQEEVLLSGQLEPTNEPYAIAKIAGIKLCESYNREYQRDYRSVMPTNLYGPGDNYHLENSHVIPALIRRFHEAKAAGLQTVAVWGSGNPRREFLHVDDMANACVKVMNTSNAILGKVTTPMCSHINVGYGSDFSIREVASLISGVVGFQGRVIFDTHKQDGAPQKLMDSSKLLSLGWRPLISFEDGLKNAYQSFLSEVSFDG